ncbi:MAG TPA: DUF4249 domain-containing protein [Ohtaekwangia sp.]|uniref:DUF4249 domain-containing protein n=1 Tax=Ohtaekwangia sp. TaxID=2066019 RepID=UPI002F95E4B2
MQYIVSTAQSLNRSVRAMYIHTTSFNRIFLLAALVMLAASCEETVVLKLNNDTPRIVIEGQVTNHPFYQYVKVSKSVSFYTSGKTPRITDATVRIEDDQGNHIDFVHNPRNHADSVGYYLPPTSFIGQVGRTYTLTVVAEGQTYTAQDKLNPITNIEKLEYRVDEDEAKDPELAGRIYEVLMYVKEPKETRDYYLFKTYRNDSLTYDRDSDIYYADDELVGEKIDGFPLPVFFSMNDKARAEVLSLSREAYIFYRDLDKLLNNDGGMFDQPAAEPRTNLSNGALGLFQASAVTSKEIRVGE